MTLPRRAVALAAVSAAVAGGAVAVPAALAAHTQQLNIAAELVKQPAGRPWTVNLLLGANLDTDDGSVPAPVHNMQFKFTSGAQVHSDAFKTCTPAILEKQGPSKCPAGSKLGSGTAIAKAIGLTIHANILVFNGPGTTSKRQLIVWAKAVELPNIQLTFPGTFRKTSGKYGFQLDLPIPPIPTVGEGNDASITSFNVKVGGYGTLKGKKTPFIEAPTSCRSPGWPFAATFTYADGASGSASALIDCTIKAVSGS